MRNPAALRDFQAQWESPLFGLFHGAAFSIAHLPTNCAIEPPFEGQGSHRSMVILTTLALLLVIGTRPNRLGNRVSRPFVKTLPQKLRTRPAKMHL